MAIQLAYKKMSGHFGATYESVQVRNFRHGRTECVRTCSEDSANWINELLKIDSIQETSTLNIRAFDEET